MKFLTRFACVVTVLSSALCIPLTAAQNTPGVSISAATVSTDIQTLFDLAEQAYPTLFANTTGWRSHGGYTYQYYAAGGIYAGVKEGNVYLLGGGVWYQHRAKRHFERRNRGLAKYHCQADCKQREQWKLHRRRFGQ